MPRFTPQGQPEATADPAAAAVLEDPANAEAAEQAMKAADPGMATRMAERLGRTANATAVFGAPVDRDGRTVIPVARARYGFGAGEGDEGSGGGGGVAVTPVGWIEIDAAGSRFRPMRPQMAVAGVLGLGLGLVAGAIVLSRGASRRDLRLQRDAMIGRVLRTQMRWIVTQRVRRR